VATPDPASRPKIRQLTGVRQTVTLPDRPAQPLKDLVNKFAVIEYTVFVFDLFDNGSLEFNSEDGSICHYDNQGLVKQVWEINDSDYRDCKNRYFPDLSVKVK